MLTIDNGKVTYDKKNDLPANNFPYNVAVTPNGKIALIANTGNGGSSDGNADTVSVVDLEAKPIRIIDHITVGDLPEGLVDQSRRAISRSRRGARLQPAEGHLVLPPRRRGQRAADRRQDM